MGFTYCNGVSAAAAAVETQSSRQKIVFRIMEFGNNKSRIDGDVLQQTGLFDDKISFPKEGNRFHALLLCFCNGLHEVLAGLEVRYVMCFDEHRRIL